MTRPRQPGPDDGETLVELMIAVVLLASTGVILVSGLSAVVLSARQQASASITHLLGISAAEDVVALPFLPCGGPADYQAGLDDPPADPGTTQPGYVASVTEVADWDTRGSYATVTTTLTTSVTSTGTVLSIPAEAADALPDQGPYQLQIDGGTPELTTVVAGFGTTDLSVQRAVGATAHPARAELQVCAQLQRVTVDVTAPDGRHQSVVVSKRNTLATSPTGSPAAPDPNQPIEVTPP